MLNLCFKSHCILTFGNYGQAAQREKGEEEAAARLAMQQQQLQHHDHLQAQQQQQQQQALGGTDTSRSWRAEAHAVTPLPPGWEACRDAQSGRTFYRNHVTRQANKHRP
jgi:hypothetical protein